MGDKTKLTKAERRRLPDWKDSTTYKSSEKWSGNRWAWEFLQRNANFRQQCDDLPKPNSPSRRLAEESIAKAFGLRRFKHIDERYGRQHERRPSFVPIVAWNVPDDNLQRSLGIELFSGQCLIRFDLNHASRDLRWLEVQLRLAEKTLKKELGRKGAVAAGYGANQKKLSYGRARGTAKERLEWLRLLDAEAAGATSSEAYKVVCAQMAEGKSQMEITKQHAEAMRPARDYAKSRYFLFSVTQKSPTPRKTQSD